VPRVLAFIEALGVTGAARTLLDTHVIDVSQRSRRFTDLHIATYRRRTGDAQHHNGLDALVEAVRSRGIPITVIDEGRAFDPALPFRVNRTLAAVGPDIVETHNIKSHALVACAPARASIPWLAFHHGYTDTDLKVRVYNRLDRWALRRADAVVTTCRAFADNLCAAGVERSRISVVHGAIAPAAIPDRAAARRALGMTDADQVVLAVGRLSREKGHDTLVDACAALDSSMRARITVLIAGDGPESARLAEHAASAGVSLRLDGFQGDVAPYYAAADVFVLPSRSEGSPTVLLEAIAAGCSVVAACVGGVPEIVEHGVSALLVSPERPLSLRDAIAALLENPASAARLAGGARRAASGFTCDARRATLRAIYARLTSRAGVLAGAAS